MDLSIFLYCFQCPGSPCSPRPPPTLSIFLYCFPCWGTGTAELSRSFQFFSIVSRGKFNGKPPGGENFQFFSIVSGYYEPARPCFNGYLSIFLYCFTASCSSSPGEASTAFQFFSIVSIRRSWGLRASLLKLSIFLYCFRGRPPPSRAHRGGAFNFSLLFHPQLLQQPQQPLVVLSIFLYCFSISPTKALWPAWLSFNFSLLFPSSNPPPSPATSSHFQFFSIVSLDAREPLPYRLGDFQFFSIVSDPAPAHTPASDISLSIFLYCFIREVVADEDEEDQPFNFSLLFRILGRGWRAPWCWSLSIFLYCFLRETIAFAKLIKSFNFSLLFPRVLNRRCRQRGNFQFFSIVSHEVGWVLCSEPCAHFQFFSIVSLACLRIRYS